MDPSYQRGPYTGLDWVQATHLYERVIASENEALQIRATVELGWLSEDVPESILAQMVPILVELLGRPLGDHQPSIQEAAAYCLNCFTRRGDGALCMHVGQSGAIPSILGLLPQSAGRFQRILAKCLRNIVSCDSLSRVILARNGGLEVILDVIASCSDDTRPYLLEILSALVMVREVRRVLVNLDGLSLLIESAGNGKMVSRTRAAHAIGLLGVTRRLRQKLVDLGVIPVLVGLLQDGDMLAKLTAGNALGIISSHVDYLRPVARAGAIPLFAELLEGPDPLGKEIAEDVFCILAVAEENAVLIAGHLVRVLQGGNDEAKAAAADVLWDLSGYKHSVSVVRESGAIPLLIGLLSCGNNDVREKAAGAVTQLSYNEADREDLVNAGAVPILLRLLHDESEEVKDNAAEALINFSEDPSLSDRISEVFDIPAFQNILDRLARIRASDEHMVRSLDRMNVEQFTEDPELA
ncbi:U-box domain-containing protein 4 [Magnolia sinica]|uniref:U-box domain-containing protein 4 n=1 Tax=Magnolia sinica TaxID=86752 RepID=UPI00265A6E32|nr:U-box domain-containing protein 4 [Magnolia sinica]XP_058070670.1 U-box domain-containing protein 4 [Magnolia sinica]